VESRPICRFTLKRQKFWQVLAGRAHDSVMLTPWLGGLRACRRASELESRYWTRYGELKLQLQTARLENNVKAKVHRLATCSESH